MLDMTVTKESKKEEEQTLPNVQNNPLIEMCQTLASMAEQAISFYKNNSLDQTLVLDGLVTLTSFTKEYGSSRCEPYIYMLINNLAKLLLPFNHYLNSQKPEHNFSKMLQDIIAFIDIKSIKSKVTAIEAAQFNKVALLYACANYELKKSKKLSPTLFRTEEMLIEFLSYKECRERLPDDPTAQTEYFDKLSTLDVTLMIELMNSREHLQITKGKYSRNFEDDAKEIAEIKMQHLKESTADKIHTACCALVQIWKDHPVTTEVTNQLPKESKDTVRKIASIAKAECSFEKLLELTGLDPTKDINRLTGLPPEEDKLLKKTLYKVYNLNEALEKTLPQNENVKQSVQPKIDRDISGTSFQKGCKLM